MRTFPQRYDGFNPLKQGWCLPLPRKLVNSEAFLSLSGPAAKLLIHFYSRCNFTHHPRRKKDQFQPTNIDELKFSYAAAKELGYSSQRFNRYRNELIAKGFISLVVRNTGTDKEPNLYALSGRWKDYGQPGFEEIVLPKEDSENSFTTRWKEEPEKLTQAIKKNNPKAKHWKKR